MYSGLIEFLEEQQLTPTMLYLFKTRNGELAARVNIPSDQQEIIESDDIPWPEGVIVNKWMSKHQLNQQRNAKRERPKKWYNGTDYYDHTDTTDENEDVLRVHTDLNKVRPTWFKHIYFYSFTVHIIIDKIQIIGSERKHKYLYSSSP